MSREERGETNLEEPNSVLTLDEDDDVQRECCVCKEIPDSIICLSCSHCICLKCAGTHLITKEDPSIEEFECPICGEYTLLSEEIQEALILMFQNGEISPEEYQEEEENEEEDEEETRNINDEEEVYVYEDGDLDQKELSVGEIIDNLEDFEDVNSQNENKLEERGEEEEILEESSKYEEAEDTNLTEMMESTGSEISLHFVCMDHPKEEYCYYSPSNRQLLCPKCVILKANKRKESDVRPLRKCIPLILQHFEDFLNTVEVNKSLTGNQMKEIEIKSEEIKGRVSSLRNKIELKFEEIYDSLRELKDSVLVNFDKNWSVFFEQLEACNQYLETKVMQFDNILEQIGEIQSNSDSITEDLLGFFFSNQEELQETLKTEEDQKEYNQFIKDYHEKTSRIEKKLSLTFERSHQTILEEVKRHFEEVLDPENLVENQMEKIRNTIKSSETMKRRASEDIMKPLASFQQAPVMRETASEKELSSFQERAMKLRKKLDNQIVVTNNSSHDQNTLFESKDQSSLRQQLSPNLKLEVDRNMFTLNSYFKNQTHDQDIDGLRTSKFEKMFQKEQPKMNTFQQKIEMLKQQNLSKSHLYKDGFVSGKSSFSFRKRGGLNFDKYSSSKAIENDWFTQNEPLRNSRYYGNKSGKSTELRGRLDSVFSKQGIWDDEKTPNRLELGKKYKYKSGNLENGIGNNRLNYSGNGKLGNNYLRNKSSNVIGKGLGTYSFHKSSKNSDLEFKPVSRIDVKDFQMFRERVRNRFGKTRPERGFGYSKVGF